MSTICSHCGEELIGAVNRCWRCGREFQIDALADVPPIRRSPILPQYLQRAPSDQPLVTTPPEATAEVELITAELVPASPQPLRLDSPFLSDSATPARQFAFPWLVIAFAVGGIGGLLCFISPIGILPLQLAIGLIIWRASIAPARQVWLLLLIAAIMLLIAGVRLSYSLHSYFFGFPPFGAPWP
ncbi:MAG: hypothetical protein ACIALR_06305 [Blastopirellula sp. JB062]